MSQLTGIQLSGPVDTGEGPGAPHTIQEYAGSGVISGSTMTFSATFQDDLGVPPGQSSQSALGVFTMEWNEKVTNFRLTDSQIQWGSATLGTSPNNTASLGIYPANGGEYDAPIGGAITSKAGGNPGVWESSDYTGPFPTSWMTSGEGKTLVTFGMQTDQRFTSGGPVTAQISLSAEVSLEQKVEGTGNTDARLGWSNGNGFVDDGSTWLPDGFLWGPDCVVVDDGQWIGQATLRFQAETNTYYSNGIYLYSEEDGGPAGGIYQCTLQQGSNSWPLTLFLIP